MDPEYKFCSINNLKIPFVNCDSNALNNINSELSSDTSDKFPRKYGEFTHDASNSSSNMSNNKITKFHLHLLGIKNHQVVIKVMKLSTAIQSILKLPYQVG